MADSVCFEVQLDTRLSIPDARREKKFLFGQNDFKGDQASHHQDGY